jgi:hypothetical protein
MPYGGDYSARSPGEGPLTFSFDFAGDLAIASGEYLSSASATLTVYSGADANVATLLVGAPSIVASLQPAVVALGSPGWRTVVAQQIGANPTNVTGFLASTVYQWSVTTTTSLGNTLIWKQRIPIGTV